jgi:hypothetical protein
VKLLMPLTLTEAVTTIKQRFKGFTAVTVPMLVLGCHTIYDDQWRWRVIGMRSGERNRSSRRKPARVPLCPQRIPGTYC